MINVQIIGAKELVAKFNSMPDALHRELLKEIVSLSMQVKAHIVQDKLQGQVLNHITGQLYGSIQQDVTETANSITGRVYSANCNYAAVHEYGLMVKTRLGTGKGKPKEGGVAQFKMPERSFMRSSLEDYRQRIMDGLNRAVERVVKA